MWLESPEFSDRAVAVCTMGPAPPLPGALSRGEASPGHIRGGGYSG